MFSGARQRMGKNIVVSEICGVRRGRKWVKSWKLTKKKNPREFMTT